MKYLLLAVFALFPLSLSAHSTLFGAGARTIWKGGTEVEAEMEFEIFRRFYSYDNPDKNPRDVRLIRSTFTVALTHGITRDLAIRGQIPVAYARKTSKDDSESYFGPRDAHVGLKYRIFNNPFKGGATQLAVWATARIPTAKKREDISFGDETWGLIFGTSFSWSTTRHYFWLDIAGDVSTRRSGTGKGMAFQVHPAYAIRVFELTNYKDFDLILLFEGDFLVREKGEINDRQNDNSGYIKTHLGAGVQMNITNKIELKLGYHMPVYRLFYGRQFVHDGLAKISFNYLF